MALCLTYTQTPVLRCNVAVATGASCSGANQSWSTYSMPILTVNANPSSCANTILTGSEYQALVTATNTNTTNIVTVSTNVSSLQTQFNSLQTGLNTVNTNSNNALAQATSANSLAGSANTTANNAIIIANNALTNSGGTTTTAGSAFDLTIAEGSQIAGAILLVWATAWAIKQLLNLIKESDVKNETN